MPQFRPRPTKRAQHLRNNGTDAERKLWRNLSRRDLRGFKFSRQIPVGPFIVDFLCRERGLIVEVDGGQHCQSRNDHQRTAFLENEGFRLIRFWNDDVLQNMDGVLQVILANLQELPAKFTKSNLPLAGREEGHGDEGMGLEADIHTHPQPPPASGRGLE
jgi:very-short-patch-repair endonuclease